MSRPILEPTHIEHIEFNDGTSITVSETGIIAFVGPNNSGKTTTLREIQHILSINDYKTEKHECLIVNKVALNIFKNDNLFENFIKQIESQQITDDHGYKALQLDGDTLISDYQWRDALKQYKSLGKLASYYTQYHDPIERPKTANFYRQANPRYNETVSAVEEIVNNQEKLNRLKNAFQTIFNQDLTLDRRRGEVGFRIGSEPKNAPRMNEPYTDSVNAEYDARPSMEVQGLGMKSALGILINLIAGDTKIHLIDEPEAFLHPPQAKRLGIEIGTICNELSKQIFISSHDRNIVEGLIYSQSDIQMIRLERNQEKPSTKLIERKDIENLSTKKFTRYSLLIDALFHTETWVVEAESDAIFFRAATERYLENNENLRIRHPDEVLIITCGGKDNLHQAVDCLQRIKIEPKVLVDFDILNNPTKFSRLYNHFSDDWNEIKTHYNELYKFCDDYNNSELEILDSKSIWKDFLKTHGVNNPPTLRELRALNKSLQKPTGWKQMKSLGIDAEKFPSTSLSLIKHFYSHNVFIVPYGELENFEKTDPKNTTPKTHGPKWVQHALESKLDDDRRVQNFIHAVFENDFSNIMKEFDDKIK